METRHLDKAQESQRQPQNIHFYDLNKNDYVKTITLGTTTIGLAEIQGMRREQEDAIALPTPIELDAIQQVQDMNEQNIAFAYEACFAGIQIDLATHQSIGTTCSSAIAWLDSKKNTVIVETANLGDSEMNLIIINNNIGEPQFRTLTASLTTLHNPRTPNEFKRLESVPFQHYNVAQHLKESVSGWDRRLPNGLALSRAFGDLNSEVYGLIHTPEIQRFEILLAEDEKAYLLGCCDGVRESILKLQELADMICENINKPEADIAEIIIRNAYQYGSRDNISVGIFQVSTQVNSLTILDGHGGQCLDYSAGQLASDIAKQFYPRLIAQLELIKKLQNKLSDEQKNNVRFAKEYHQLVLRHALDTRSIKLFSSGDDEKRRFGSFITHLNQDQDSHHIERGLGYILRLAFAKNPNLANELEIFLPRISIEMQKSVNAIEISEQNKSLYDAVIDKCEGQFDAMIDNLKSFQNGMRKQIG